MSYDFFCRDAACCVKLHIFLSSFALLRMTTTKTTTMEIDYKKLEEFGITNEDPKWDNDNWLAKKQPTQKRLDI